MSNICNGIRIGFRKKEYHANKKFISDINIGEMLHEVDQKNITYKYENKIIHC